MEEAKKEIRNILFCGISVILDLCELCIISAPGLFNIFNGCHDGVDILFIHPFNLIDANLFASSISEIKNVFYKKEEKETNFPRAKFNRFFTL